MSSSFRVPVVLSESILGLKWDSGAKHTVISVRVLKSDLLDDDLESVKGYCESNCKRKERFVSASGHSFDGYLITAHHVKVGNANLPEFHYYLVVENQRDVALLGYDFVDCCKSFHNPHDDIIVTEFDDEEYGKRVIESMDSDELLAYIDSLSSVL